MPDLDWTASVNSRDPTPLHAQLERSIRAAIASRRLRPGDQLPTVRKLAEQLVINPNTVARAYRELESSGIVEKRRTAGTYVSDQGSPLARRERLKILTERVDALLAEARQMGIDFDDVVKLAERRQAAMLSTTMER